MPAFPRYRETDSLNNWLEQFMDRRLGVVLCFILSLLEKVRLMIVPGARIPSPVRRILFVKPVEQGALVLAYGAIKHAVERVGRENVFVFVFAKNREILDILNVVPRENVITVRDASLAVLALDMLRAIVRMHRLNIDTAIDLEIFARISIILCWLSGARRRVGLHRFNSEGPYRGALVTHRVQYNPYLHTSQAFDIFVRSAFTGQADAPLLKETPVSPLCPPPPFIPDPADVAEVNRALNGFQVEIYSPIFSIPNVSMNYPRVNGRTRVLSGWAPNCSVPARGRVS